MFFFHRVTSKAEGRPCGFGRGSRSNCLFWVASSKETPAKFSSLPSSSSPHSASVSNQPKYTRESTNCGFKVRLMRFKIIQLLTEKVRLSPVYNLKIVKVYQINTMWHIALLVEYQIPMQRGGEVLRRGGRRAGTSEPSRFRLPGRVLHAPRLHSKPRHIRPLIR